MGDVVEWKGGRERYLFRLWDRWSVLGNQSLTEFVAWDNIDFLVEIGQDTVDSPLQARSKDGRMYVSLFLEQKLRKRD